MFWPTYPWWKHLFPSHFDSFPFERDMSLLPPSTIFYHHSNSSTSLPLLSSICEFLFTYFSEEPKLVHTPNSLLSSDDHVFVLYHKISYNILATIRYHYLGKLYSLNDSNSPPIYVVDSFCVHPEWRNKGLGSYLLNRLHQYANDHSIPYAFFLKEGPSLPIISFPILSGSYVFRNLHQPLQYIFTSMNYNIYSLTFQEAHTCISSYMKICPDTFLIYRSNSSSALWKLYRSPPYSILACFQDTHQRIMNDYTEEQKMGWITVWLESPSMTDDIRHQASILLSKSVSNKYEWIWMNRQWIGKKDGSIAPWKEDGGFHWYTYQWNTNSKLKQSYGIMVD